MYDSYLLVTLSIAAGLAIIPASIARKKGYSFGLWWFYGWMLWIVAIIHVQFIEDKTSRPSTALTQTANTLPDTAAKAISDQHTAEMSFSATPVKPKTPVEQIREFKELYDAGILTEEEFTSMKSAIISKM